MCVCVCVLCTCACAHTLSCVQLFETPWTAACQAPLSTGFPRQEYRGGLTFSPPGELPDPGIKPASTALSGDSLPLSPPGNH